MRDVAHKLSAAEQTRFFELKDIIRENLIACFDVGAALLEIRNSKLYRQDFDTFEEFCQVQYKIGKSSAYRLIEASEVRAKLEPEQAELVTNESQARALANVPPEKREEVLAKAAANGPVTAASIEQAAKPPPKPKKPVDPIELDRTGFPIPAKLLPFWHRASEVQGLLTSISRIRTALRGAQEQDDPLWRPVSGKGKDASWSRLQSNLDNAYATIGLAMPYAVCPTCQGHLTDRCASCQERGFVSEFWYNHNLDADSRKVRESVCKKGANP